MVLFFRCIQVLLLNCFKPRQENVYEPYVQSFRVSPFDLDTYVHMNNAKYSNYTEACRLGIQLRSGFLKTAVKNGWIGPIVKTIIEYYRPLKFFQKFEVRSQIVLCKGDSFCFLHQFFVGSKEHTRSLVIGTVRKGRENVLASEYLAILGYPSPKKNLLGLNANILEWIEQQGIVLED